MQVITHICDVCAAQMPYANKKDSMDTFRCLVCHKELHLPSPPAKIRIDGFTIPSNPIILDKYCKRVG